MTDGASSTTPAKRRNWWKVGFFLMLVLFEGAREWAVIASAEKAQPIAMKHIFRYQGFVSAKGRWLRSDGGSPIVPGTVTIECVAEQRQCIEASVSSSGKDFYAPEIDRFDATFSDQGVQYVNDRPDCATYSVNIDTKAERAIATRIRKPNPSNAMCANLEPRIAMELGGGFIPGVHPTEGHFVPLLDLLIGVFKLFD